MSLSLMQLITFLYKSKLNGSFWTPIYEHTYFFLIFKIHIIILFSLLFSGTFEITSYDLNQIAFFPVFVLTILLVPGSVFHSHFILNTGNCSLGYIVKVMQVQRHAKTG